MKKNTIYFAFGSNMNLVQMAYRCPHSIFLKKEKLPNWSFIITNRGFANIVPEKNRVVRGCLWNLTKKDEETLDQYEGINQGYYDKKYMKVGEYENVLIYISKTKETGSVWNDYLNIITEGAEQINLETDYIFELQSWNKKNKNIYTEEQQIKVFSRKI